MTRLNEAHDRLAKAVGRLEQAAGKSYARGAQAAAESNGANRADDAMVFRRQADEISGRLDNVIERLRGVLAQ